MNHRLLTDRRRRRTANRAIALRYQLEHTKEKAGFEALVLADDNGLVVVGAGDPSVCEQLGAYAPLFGRTFFGMSLPPLLRGGDVAVMPMQMFGQRLFVVGIGGGVARDALLRDSIGGVERILTAN